MRSNFINLAKVLTDKSEALQAAGAKTEQKIEEQKKILSETEKSKENAFNDVASLREQVVVAGTREAEIRSSVSAASSRVARATGEIYSARNMMPVQSKELAKIAQLNSSIKRLDDNVGSHETSEEELKDKLAAAMKDSTWLNTLFDDIRAEAAEIGERSGAKRNVVRSNVEDSSAPLLPSLRCLVEILCAGLTNAVN